MAKQADEMTHEDWKKILLYLMQTNNMVAQADRDQQQAAQSVEGGSGSYWYNRPQIIEVREAAREIDDMIWLKLGVFIGRES